MRWLMLIALLIVFAAAPAAAQDDAVCAAARAALMSAVQTCAQTARGEICFGQGGLTAGARSADVAFSTPGDTAAVGAFDWLEAAPLTDDAAGWGVAVLRLQADLADDGGRQSVLGLLVGGARLVNQTMTQTVVPAVVNSRARVRSTPSTETDSNILALLESGTRVTAVGRDATGEWIQVRYEGGVGWTAAFLLAPRGNFADLGEPVDGAPAAHSPMGAFALTGTPTSSTCAELPPPGVLLVPPSGERVSLEINGVGVSFDAPVYVSLTDAVGAALKVELFGGTGAVLGMDGAEFLVAGSSTVVPLSIDGLSAAGAPFEPQPNAAERYTELASLMDLVPTLDRNADTQLEPPPADVSAAIAQTFAPDGLLAGYYELVNMTAYPFEGTAEQCAGDYTLGVRQYFGPNTANAIETAYGVRIALGVQTNGAELSDHNDPAHRALPERAGEVGTATILVNSMTDFTAIETWARREGDFAAACHNEFTWRWVSP